MDRGLDCDGSRSGAAGRDPRIGGGLGAERNIEGPAGVRNTAAAEHGKQRQDQPGDEEEDYDWPVWAGVLKTGKAAR